MLACTAAAGLFSAPLDQTRHGALRSFHFAGAAPLSLAVGLSMRSLVLEVCRESLGDTATKEAPYKYYAEYTHGYNHKVVP